MKKILSILFSIVLCITLIPIRVFADSNTYNLAPKNRNDGTLNNDSDFYFYQTNHSEIDTRFCIIYINSWTSELYVFNNVNNSINYQFHYGNSGYGGNSSISYTNNGNTYYYAKFSSGANTVYQNVISKLSTLYPNIVHNGTSSNALQIAFNNTFGNDAIDPEPPAPPTPDYGDIVNVGYNTKIAGSGDAAINNLDTITWNPEQDSNGNDISDMSVTIRAVPGKYSAQSSQSILEQLYSNFVLDTLHVSELDTVNASDGSFSVTWNDVVHEFDLLGIPGFWFATKDTVKDPEGGYIKRGWIYQVRLEGEDYIGEWQTVYTATSSGVQNDLTIVNSSTINQTLINSITEVNNLNNTENNWYINNTTINMGEYSDPGSSGKPWWAYLLEAIVSLLNGVIDAIANLVGSLIDGLLGLFSFDSFSIPDFATNKQTIKQNSGIFGESIDLLQGINSTLSNADGTAEPILYYPGLELMGEEFIPEITINLNTYVSDLGLTEWHNLAYVCTDAMIWISLIYTIYRKLIGVFKK